MRKITKHLRYDYHKSQIMGIPISQHAGHLTKIKFIHFEKATELEEIPHSQYGQSKSEYKVKSW